MSPLHVPSPDDHEPTSVEARLGTMTMMSPPAHLRQRVLAAVDAVLAEPSADIARDDLQWALLATATAAMLLVASWGGSLGLGRSVADAMPLQPVSLTDRMASVGIQPEPSIQP
ncbi:MAG: hypothetical protein O3A37_00560 [Planctomycetota bacterium]|nr:hypothetical protein [Planctomycetota bacterium]